MSSRSLSKNLFEARIPGNPPAAGEATRVGQVVDRDEAARARLQELHAEGEAVAALSKVAGLSWDLDLPDLVRRARQWWEENREEYCSPR